MSQHHALLVRNKVPMFRPASPSGVGTIQNKNDYANKLTGQTSISEAETVWWFPEFSTSTAFKFHWSLAGKKIDFNWFVCVQDVLCATILPPLTKLASLYGHDTALLPLSLSLSVSLKQAHTYFFPPKAWVTGCLENLVVTQPNPETANPTTYHDQLHPSHPLPRTVKARQMFCRC
jgi:hypothetical protein